VAPAAPARAGATRAAARPAPAGPVPLASRQAQAAAVFRRQQGQASARAGRSLMDLAAANYAHIRTDLARIGIISVVMLAIIVALSFVLK
jgi:hypothetical protein